VILSLDFLLELWYNKRMKNLSYHGKTVEQAQWVVDNYDTPEKREFYKDNKTIQAWIEDSRSIIEARRLDY